MEAAISLVFFVAGAALGGLVGLAVGRYWWPAIRRDDAAALDAARLGARAEMLQQRLDEEAAKLLSAEAEARGAGEALARLKQREADLAEQKEQLTGEFENIANRILKATTSELSAGSQRELGALLEPLRQRLQDFQHQVETTYQSETREVLSLKEQIRLLVETSHAVGKEADGLAKALRGQSQLRGRWGEIALERILEAAGLHDGREYIAQGRGLGLRNDDGGLQKPDIIVLLPEDRSMIVDSKVPLIGYERLVAAAEEAVHAAAGRDFVRDVKAHIDGLSAKRYQDNARLAAHDCALMFVPIEGALAAALTCDPELFSYAWDRHVVLVGPSTLLMTMRTVASIWRSERQGQNTQEIARLAGELCDKVQLSLLDLNIVAEKMADANAAHNAAVKRLSTGHGNALSLGERIRGLGVKAKPMPAMLVDGARIAAEEWADTAAE
ncbi:MAG TPA: DNA recombination protein RmuC [Stellaceae bacterium]|nr:DNA recombination protein RmuC [Stellaceae bacterium]